MIDISWGCKHMEIVDKGKFCNFFPNEKSQQNCQTDLAETVFGFGSLPQFFHWDSTLTSDISELPHPLDSGNSCSCIVKGIFTP